VVRLTLKVADFYPLILAGFQNADYNSFGQHGLHLFQFERPAFNFYILRISSRLVKTELWSPGKHAAATKRGLTPIIPQANGSVALNVLVGAGG
jgi:hypothetical protein